MWRWLGVILILSGCVRAVDAEAVPKPDDNVAVSAFDGFFVESHELSQLAGQQVKYMGGYDEPAYGDDGQDACSGLAGFDGNGQVFGRDFNKFRWRYYRNEIAGRHQEYRELLALWPDGVKASEVLGRVVDLLDVCKSDPTNAMVKFGKTSGPALTWRLAMVDGICAFDTRIWVNLIYSAETCMTGRDEEIATKIASMMEARIRGVA